MNRREAMKIMGTALAGVGVTGAVQANPWIGQSSLWTPRCYRAEQTNRAERYARYERLATDGDFPILRDDHIMNIGKMVHDTLDLQGEDEKRTFSPFRCGILLMDSAIYGDVFVEIVKPPIVYAKYSDIPCTLQDSRKYVLMPVDTVFRIETIKGKLLEFQQSRSGPDYAAVSRCAVEDETQGGPANGHAIRFVGCQIVHIRPKCHKYYPYGTSCLETGKPVLDADWLKDTRDGIYEIVQRMRT